MLDTRILLVGLRRYHRELARPVTLEKARTDVLQRISKSYSVGYFHRGPH